MIFCSKCGEPLPDDAKFCMNCGAKISADPDKENEGGREEQPRDKENSYYQNNTSAGGTYQSQTNSGNGTGGSGGPESDRGSGTDGAQKIDLDSIYNKYYGGSVVKRKINKPLLIVTIVNILFFSLLSAIALPYVLGARNAKDDAAEKASLRTALILNIVTFVVGLAFLFYYAPVYFLLVTL